MKKKIGQCGKTFLAFRKFPKFSREFAWLGKMQKSGKFSSDTLFFPLPYAYGYIHSALENSV